MSEPNIEVDVVIGDTPEADPEIDEVSTDDPFEIDDSVVPPSGPYVET